MRKVKKNMLLVGSILAIIAAVGALIGALGMFFISRVVSSDFLYEVYSSDPMYIVTDEADGGYIVYDSETGVEVLNSDDMDIVVSVAKVVITAASIFLIIFGASNLTLGILLLIKTCKNKYSKGLNIALLVSAALSGEMLVLGFMIAGLCIKNTNPQDEDPKPISNQDVETIVIE